MPGSETSPSFAPAGVINPDDTLFTLCLLNPDIRFLTMERIRDVVAAGMQLQREAEAVELKEFRRTRDSIKAKRKMTL